MKQEKEKKLLGKQWKKMRKHFKAFAYTQDAEALHQFRVQVKKVRSFLTLLETNKKNSELLDTFKPIKKVFKSAGIVRDAFLHQQQAKAHHITLKSFYEAQDALQKRETAKLIGKSKKHLQQMKLVRKKLQKQLHPVSPHQIQVFYKEQLANTQQLLAQNDFSEELHNGRKMLKHLMYNQHAVQGGVAKELSINFHYIDELQDVLGQWHDNKLALSFFQNKLAAKELKTMEGKKAQLQAQIREQTKDFEKKIIATPS
jgi:CHAD domain-containing protein